MNGIYNLWIDYCVGVRVAAMHHVILWFKQIIKSLKIVSST